MLFDWLAEAKSAVSMIYRQNTQNNTALFVIEELLPTHPALLFILCVHLVCFSESLRVWINGAVPPVTTGRQ